MVKLWGRTEKISRKRAAATVLIAAIVLLAFFNLYLASTGKSILNFFVQESETLLEYKSEARKTHESIQSMLNDVRNLVQEKSAESYESYEQQLMLKFLSSMHRDLEWIADEESEIYGEMQQTLSEEIGEGLLGEEIAILISTDIILTLNLEASNVGIENYADAEVVIEEVQLGKDDIMFIDFMPEGFTELILIGTNIREEDIRKNVKEIFEKFLEFKKSEFDNAFSDEKYVEATKLVGLNVLFTLQ